MEKPKAKKKSNWSKIKHKTYDDSKGFGNPESWKESFSVRMGEKKEMKFFADCDTLQKLGLKYRELIRKYHPDLAGDTVENKKMSQEIITEYQETRKELNKQL